MAKELCDRCKRDEASPEHTCPYQVEMAFSDDDYQPLCNCCDDCYSNCSGDI